MVLSQANVFEIYDGHSGTRTGFSPSKSVPPMPHTICIYTHNQEEWEKAGIPQKSSPVSATGDELIENYFHFILSPRRVYPLTFHP